MDKELRLRIAVDKTELSGIDNFVQNWSKQLGYSMTAIGAAITGGLGLTVAAFADAQKSSIQLDAVLKSTNGAAGLTREGLEALATSLSRVTAVDDDVILKNEALMLTFTQVGKEIFPEAIQAAINLSSVMGQDLQSSIVQIGKALNDPVAGMTALKKVGVSFTADQKDMIKELVASGDAMGAQKLILAELATEFGGAAAAQAKGLTGQLSSMKNEVQNLEEAIGGALVPALSGLATAVLPIVIGVTDWAKANPDLMTSLVGITAAVGAFAVVVGPLLIALPGISVALGALPVIFAALTGPIGLAVLAVVGLVAAGVALYENSETVRSTVDAAWRALSDAAVEIFGNIKAVVLAIAADLKAIWEEHKNWLVPILKAMWQSVKDIFEGSFTILKGLVQGGLDIIKGIVEVFTGIFTGDWEKFCKGISDIWEGVWKILAGIVDGYWKMIKGSVNLVWEGVKGLFQAGVEATLAYWKGLWNALAGVVTAAWNGIKGAVQGVTDGVTGFFQGMYDKVVGHSIVPEMMAAIAASFGTLSGSGMRDPAKFGIDSTISIFDGAFGDSGSILGTVGKFGTSLTSMITSIAKSMANAFIKWGVSVIDDALGGLLTKIGITGGGSGAGGGGGLPGAAAGFHVGGFAGAATGAFLGGKYLGEAFGGGTGGAVAGATVGFLGAELIANIGASIAAGTGLGAGVSGFSSALFAPILGIPGLGAIIVGAIIGISTLIAFLTKRGKQKIHDTKEVEPFWQQLWALEDEYSKSPATGSPEQEIVAREAMLASGIGGWNEVVKNFELKSSGDSQRKYIYAYIDAVNSIFSGKYQTYGDTGFTPDTSSLPITPLATGGIVRRPTFALLGEDGPEAVIPLKKGRGWGATINQTNYFGQANDLLSQRRMMDSVNRSLARQLT